MSRETREYLGSLYNGYDEHGPQINWTRGFEGDSDQYNNYNNQQSDRNYSNNQWDTNNTHWDSNTETDDWNN
jgi:hypothetical protein